MAVKSSNTKSVAEIADYEAKQRTLQQKFAAAKSALQLIDLTKTETRTFSTFSKETLRNYMRNPKANESNLRNLSRFLYRVSHNYRRLINYYAEMIDLTAVSVIPVYNPLEPQTPEEIMELYYNTLTQIDKMAMHTQIFKCLLIAWREDTFYGYTYEDDSGFFIYPLDGEYCKVSSMNFDGTLNFAYDFSYFRSHQMDLEYWDPEFNSKYNSYQSDNNLRWQELDPERTICLKINIDDVTMSLPPLIGLFNSIIDLIDLQGIESIKDDLSIYKLLVARMDTLSNTDEPDDFAVDIDTAIEYYNRLAESLPECVSSVISPLPIDTIEFKSDQTEDVNRMSNAMSNFFQMSGGAQILDNDQISGSTAFTAAILCDTLMGIRSLLPQIEAWMNRYLTYIMSDHAKIKYLEVSPYTKAEKKKELLESGQNGVPVKLAVAALDGFSPLEVMSMDFLENQVLRLHETWVPFSTSYTQTGDSSPSEGTDPIKGGAPKKDDISPEGEATRDGDKNDA